MELFLDTADLGAVKKLNDILIDLIAHLSLKLIEG